MAVVSSFPLLRLPKNATSNTLLLMDYSDLFEISLASKNSKDLVQSLKIKALKFTVHLLEYPCFKVKLRLPRRVRKFRTIHDLLPENKEIHYKTYSNKMDGETFINHLKFIFHTKKIEVLFGFKSKYFDFEPLLKGRRDIESVCFITNNEEKERRIVNIMKPPQADMFFVTKPYEDLLIQNFDYLGADLMIICLDDLLISNIRNFDAGCQMVPTKVLNRFLKLWMRGSNSQLESLKLRFSIDNNYQQEEIFSRLKTKQSNTVKLGSGGRRINGGTDILRFDGTMATVIVHNRQGIFNFEMLVWHDHCMA